LDLFGWEELWEYYDALLQFESDFNRSLLPEPQRVLAMLDQIAADSKFVDIPASGPGPSPNASAIRASLKLDSSGGAGIPVATFRENRRALRIPPREK
jgi:hypothetical protein